MIAAAGLLGPRDAHAVVVRFQFTIPQPGGPSVVETIDVRMFQTAMPRTVANFLEYVDDNDWDGSVIHRRSAAADSGVGVVQGGGYIIPPEGLIKDVGGQLFFNYNEVESGPRIDDEPGGGVAGPSNVTGTIAMAKSGPNTATHEWYFNYVDNTQLDAPVPSTGGFSAFGRILGTGMSTINKIVALPRYNVGGAFGTLPVKDVAKINSQINVFNEDVVVTNDVRRLNIPDGDYNFDGRVNAVDLNIWKTAYGSTTALAADGNGDGRVNAADYLVWQRTLGQNFGTPAGATTLAVPEPATAALALLGFGALGRVARRGRRRA